MSRSRKSDTELQCIIVIILAIAFGITGCAGDQKASNPNPADAGPEVIEKIVYVTKD